MIIDTFFLYILFNVIKLDYIIIVNIYTNYNINCKYKYIILNNISNLPKEHRYPIGKKECRIQSSKQSVMVFSICKYFNK